MDGDLLFLSVLLCKSRKHNNIKINRSSKTLQIGLEEEVATELGGRWKDWGVKSWPEKGVGLGWFEALFVAAEIALEVSLDLLDELLLYLSRGRSTPKRGL